MLVGGVGSITTWPHVSSGTACAVPENGTARASPPIAVATTAARTFIETSAGSTTWAGTVPTVDAGCQRLRARSGRSIRAATEEQRRDGLGEDGQVDEERPVVDVVEVEAGVVLEGGRAAPVDLPEAGDAGLDPQPVVEVLRPVLDLGRERGPGT